uniref:Uncharacterized protein n=1 Tax=Ditylenchus dipsaci TaxID=166011 RepID=A0A915DRZ6_9BILA
MYVVLADRGDGFHIPIAHALLPNKKRATYDKMWSLIKSQYPTLQPDNYTDFRIVSSQWPMGNLSEQTESLFKEADLHCTDPINWPTFRTDMFYFVTRTPRVSYATAFSSSSNSANIKPKQPYSSDQPIECGSLLAMFLSNPKLGKFPTYIRSTQECKDIIVSGEKESYFLSGRMHTKFTLSCNGTLNANTRLRPSKSYFGLVTDNFHGI